MGSTALGIEVEPRPGRHPHRRGGRAGAAGDGGQPWRPPHRHVLRHRRPARRRAHRRSTIAPTSRPPSPASPPWRPGCRLGASQERPAHEPRSRSSPSTDPPAPARAPSPPWWPSAWAGTPWTAGRSIGSWDWPATGAGIDLDDADALAGLAADLPLGFAGTACPAGGRGRLGRHPHRDGRHGGLPGRGPRPGA